MLDARRSKFYVVAKAFFCLSAGVAMVAYIGFKGMETYRIMRGGSQAMGHVIETSDEYVESDDGRRSGFVTVAEYEFFVGGVRFTGTTEVQQYSLSKGDDLRVKFNPQNPGENRRVGDRDVAGYYFLMALIGGLFAYGLIRWSVESLVVLWRGGGHCHAFIFIYSVVFLYSYISGL